MVAVLFIVGHTSLLQLHLLGRELLLEHLNLVLFGLELVVHLLTTFIKLLPVSLGLVARALELTLEHLLEPVDIVHNLDLVELHLVNALHLTLVVGFKLVILGDECCDLVSLIRQLFLEAMTVFGVAVLLASFLLLCLFDLLLEGLLRFFLLFQRGFFVLELGPSFFQIVLQLGSAMLIAFDLFFASCDFVFKVADFVAAALLLFLGIVEAALGLL